MLYSLIFFGPDEVLDGYDAISDEFRGADRLVKYFVELRDAGILINLAWLYPSYTATTLQIRRGKRELHDGPFCEAKAQLKGHCTINVNNLDDALNWAAKAPSAELGSVEVRPIFSVSPDLVESPR